MVFYWKYMIRVQIAKLESCRSGDKSSIVKIPW